MALATHSNWTHHVYLTLLSGGRPVTCSLFEDTLRNPQLAVTVPALRPLWCQCPPSPTATSRGRSDSTHRSVSSPDAVADAGCTRTPLGTGGEGRSHRQRATLTHATLTQHPISPQLPLLPASSYAQPYARGSARSSPCEERGGLHLGAAGSLPLLPASPGQPCGPVWTSVDQWHAGQRAAGWMHSRPWELAVLCWR